jgi:hypothetical protein
MSKSRTNQPKLFSFVIGAVILLLASLALGTDYLSLSKAVVVGLYPELKGRGLHMAISDAGLLDTPGSLTSFTMEIRQPSPADTADKQCPKALLSVGFAFPVQGQDRRIFSFTALGPAVNTVRVEKLTRQVDSHPGWSDEEVLKELTAAGAHFMPTAKQDLLKRLPASSLKPLLGDISVVSADFAIRDQAQRQAHLPAAELLWTVRVIAHLNGTPDIEYYLLLEPFEGKLITLGRTHPVF